MNLQNDTAIVTETVIENAVVETVVAETTSTEVATTEAKTYTRPWMPKGQYFAMLREQGLLKPREPKATSEKPAKTVAKKAAKSVDAKAAARKEFGRRRFFANRQKAANEAAIASGAPVAPKKVYDTPYLPKGAWYKMMRETGQMAPRQPKAQVAAETVAAA